MIPMNYIVALFASTLLVLYRLVDITNKYVNILISILLSFATSASWTYVAISEYNLHLWGNTPTLLSTLVLIFLIGLPLGFLLMVITWREPLYIPQQLNQEQELYTQDTLLGMTGVVVQTYSEGAYLCKLTDKAQTSIVVYLDNAKEGDKFIIEKIENGKIFGRKL
jgi:hypothetical protein